MSQSPNNCKTTTPRRAARRRLPVASRVNAGAALSGRPCNARWAGGLVAAKFGATTTAPIMSRRAGSMFPRQKALQDDRDEIRPAKTATAVANLAGPMCDPCELAALAAHVTSASTRGSL